MGLESRGDGTVEFVLRRLVEAMRASCVDPGGFRDCPVREAIERTAAELTGATEVRMLLLGEAVSPRPAQPVRTPRGWRHSVPVSACEQPIGWIEVDGLPESLSAETSLVLQILSRQAGLSLATARALSEQTTERTRRLETEDELRAALLDVQADADLYERAPIGVHSLDAEGRFVRINETELSWLGYERDEVVGKLRMADLCTPPSRASFEEAFPRFKETGCVRDFEMELVRKDGSILPVLVTATAAYGPDGRFAFTRSIVVDLTPQRLADSSLREQARFIKRVAETTPDLVYVIDLTLRKSVFSNRELTRALGYRPDDLDAMGPDLFRTLLHPDDFAVLEELFRRFETATDEDVVETEYRLKDAGGAWRWLHSRDVVFSRDAGGRPTQILGVAKDVTQQKAAQAALSRSEVFYRTLVETFPGGVVLFDDEDRVTWLSRTARELFGIAPDAGLDGLRSTDLVALEAVPFKTERRRRLREEGKPAEPAEIRFLRRDGSSFWGLVSSAPFFDAGGRVSGGITVVLDTSERHRAEEELRHRERFIERIFRATPDAMYVFDTAERRIVFANRDLWSLAGYSAEEARALNDELLPTLLHPEDLALYSQRVARFETASDDDVHETLYRLRHKDGTWRWMHGRGVVFERDDGGHPTRLLAVVKDVTAQKRAEDALRESEAFHRALSDTVPVGIAVTDERDAITWSSPAFRELVGAPSEADVAGTPLSGWAAPGYEDLFVEHRRVPRTPGRPAWNREVLVRRHDGSTVWADVVSSPLCGADGAFRGAVVAAQDATERRQANETLKRTAERLQQLSRRVVEVQEEERRHVARELHDEIGQSLAAIYFRMQALLKAPEPVPREPIAESAEIADRTIRTVRDLSLDLHPSLLDEAGLADTLRWYVDRQVRGPGLDVELAICPTLVALPGDLRNACFRIAQSALTNVVRHARARKVRVEIGVRDGELKLVVRDDGVGFDQAATLPRVSSGVSLGLLGMQERAELLGGTIAFDSAPGGGTTVTARFPLPGNDPEEST